MALLRMLLSYSEPLDKIDRTIFFLKSGLLTSNFSDIFSAPPEFLGAIEDVDEDTRVLLCLVMALARKLVSENLE